MEEKKAKKIAFFKELYELDEPDDESEDTSGIGLILRQSTIPPSNPHPSERLRSSNPLGRTTSAPLANSSSNARNKAHVLQDGPSPSPVPNLNSPLHEGVPGAGQNMPASGVTATSRKPLSKATGKRKRGQSLELVPDSQQIFKGLAFYFIPNDDVAPSRRFRIRKTLERGALWVREWRAGITHVIVDKHLTYNDIISYLKIPSFPPDIAVVTEQYTADCMSYQFIVNPKQRQYHVEGQLQAVSIEDPPVLAPSMKPSLPPKPDSKPVGKLDEKPDDHGSSGLHNISAKVGDANPPIFQKAPNDQTGERTRPVPATGVGKYNDTVQDALDKAIDEAKAIQDLPIDFDEAESMMPSDADDASDHVDSEDENKKAMLKARPHNTLWQQGFSCMEKHDGADNVENPNSRTIQLLQQMCDYYDRMNDHWRTIAYRRVIAALRKQNRKIATKEEALAIPFVGERLAAKIEEIVWTDRLRRLDNTGLEPNDEALHMFLKIYGVGFSQATTWIRQGFRTLEDLMSKARLTRKQLIGVEHYDHFSARIPREEVEQHGMLVRKIIHEMGENIDITIGGSYRRGAPNSGDVDFIMTKPDCAIESLHEMIFETLIPRLQKLDYIKAALAVSSRKDGSMWHGAAALPGSSIWRRIDFLLVPHDEIGAALIYFTGNDIFNRSIRLLASKKGMRLNQHGLWHDVIRGRNRERITQGALVESKSEKRIFEVLGVPWRPPEHRIC
ncbi:hypothetical protein MMC07_000100 [Pseudocyphellaria aurata]|nr:hypothetical protein [Pseudocyphellaria aurata]